MIAAVYMLPTAHIACKTAGSGNLGWVGGSDRDARNVGAWNMRLARGVKLK